MSLTRLANELQFKIISYLEDDHLALRALHRANRHFSLMVKAKQVQVALFNHEKANLYMYMHFERLPCYECLNVLPITKHWFANLVAKPSTAYLGDDDAMSRRCCACDAKNGNKFLKSL
jgi:hypothetical protein